MRVFRADKRDFEVGQIISTAGEFADLHELGRKVEGILQRAKPEKVPDRTSCLMAFEDERYAHHHWAKMAGGRLYGLEIKDSDIVHRGDMKLIDEIGYAISNEPEADRLAQSYWLGPTKQTLVVELLMLEAEVREVISNDQQERREALKRVFGIGGADLG